MYGIVLGGGGTRGAYEVGALRAIKEEGIKVGAICGTSIGSINAELFAQGDFEKCEDIWRSITGADIIDMTAFSAEKLFSLKNIPTLFDELRRRGGISLEPLENILKEVVSEEKLLLSPIDFGLVTYSLTDNKIIDLFKCDIPRGMLVEYLMASSALPGVRARIISNKTYVDGGMGDNIPISVLTNKGYKNIIAIDVGGVGIVRPNRRSGVNVIEVRCNSPVIGVLDFDRKLIDASIKMGYLDTKRALGKIAGEIYSFKMSDYLNARSNYSIGIIEGLERAAQIYKISTIREYSVKSLVKKVLAEFNKHKEVLKIKDLKARNTPELTFTKLCLSCLDRGYNIAVPKKYIKAVNAVCYFSR